MRRKCKKQNKRNKTKTKSYIEGTIRESIVHNDLEDAVTNTGIQERECFGIWRGALRRKMREGEEYQLTRL